MKSINVYLTFNGNCETAMKFYEKSLGGKLEMWPFSEAPNPEWKNAKGIMHATLRAGGAALMASDATPDHSHKPGNNFSVSVDCASSAEVDQLCAALASGGKVTMPPQDTFWGAHFGMCTDQFGVQWMFNHDKS